MNFDSALTKIGEFGPYQRIQYFIVNTVTIPMYFQLLISVFLAAQPQWKCLGQPNEPLCKPDGTACSKSVYTSNFTSIATEWGLICGNTYKSEAAQSVYMAGALVGALAAGLMSDKYGRRIVWCVCIIANCIFGVLSAFSPSLYLFYVVRFFHGIFIQGGTLVTFVLATEMIGSSYRAVAAMSVSMFAAVSFVLLALLANTFRNWRSLMIVSVVPQIVSIFSMYLVPESPRWLLFQGRVQEAEDIINEAASANGLSIPKISLEKSGGPNAKPGGTPENVSLLSLFKRKSIRSITMVMLISFVVNGIGYFGISMSVSRLGEDMHVNFALSGLVEVPSYLVGVPLLNRIGRQKSNFVFTFGAAIACWWCMRLQQAEVVNSMLVTCAALFGKFCVSATNAVLYTYAAELYPTVVRNMALGVLTVSSRIGAIAAPFIVLLGNENRSTPMFIISIVTLSAALLGLKLPETKGKPLPQTFDDLVHKTVFVGTRRQIYIPSS
ncbi:organic cation transporter protein-like [Actinia tenebrosa]|uniref:Organic cation transporter protein-like n=1 Tax=Actinia tenebrosa TaxID=6105 RepID=A0A6P8J6A2_ACTTE|nr:organic cation transporter protein-like [Actinia tenebrosa]